MLWYFLFALIPITYIFCRIYIGIAKRFRIFDIPNERSSHIEVVPRGGGIAFIMAFFVSLVALTIKDVVKEPVYITLLVGGLSVGLIGLLDDIKGLSLKARLIVHVVSAIFAVSQLAELPTVFGIENYIILSVIAVIAIVWSINLFNFMDGINGLAGFEAVFISLSAALILYINDEFFHAVTLFALAMCCIGFLLLNFPAGKLFMGDSGSGFLGFCIAIYAIGTSVTDNISPWSWFILYGVFVVDATYTLITRIITRQKWWEGHSLHGYQKLTKSLKSHTSSTLYLFALNVIWLLPLAIASTYWYEYSFTFLLVAYLPLVMALKWLRAGEH